MSVSPTATVTGARRIEALQDQVTTLVRQRQQLRSAGARPASLERNRLELVRHQWQLCHALIEQHLPQIS